MNDPAMYNNLSLYYLEQLGVKPWVLRSSSSRVDSTPVRLLVWSQDALSDKGMMLLSKMLSYLALDETEVMIVDGAKSQSEIAKNLSIQSPAAILNVSPANPNLPESLASLISQDCLRIDSLHPDYLLSHPSEKKGAFADLTRLRAVLTSG